MLDLKHVCVKINKSTYIYHKGSIFEYRNLTKQL